MEAHPGKSIFAKAGEKNVRELHENKSLRVHEARPKKEPNE
jgi:hypothetical protein